MNISILKLCVNATLLSALSKGILQEELLNNAAEEVYFGKVMVNERV